MLNEGEIARERIVRNGIEHVEFRYAKYVEEKGKEAAVFGFNTLDPYGREFAAHYLGEEQVDRLIAQYEPSEITPVFWFVCGLEDGWKLLEAGAPQVYQEFRAVPAPPESFLVVGVSHEGMLPRWLPKPGGLGNH